MKMESYKLGAVILVFLATLSIIGQNFDPTRAEGQVIARGKNTVPVEGDRFKLTSYRFEIIPDLSEKSVKGKIPPYKAVRLILTGEFTGGTYIIWLNGAGRLAFVGENELIISTVGNNILFEDGLEIAVSRYGLKEPRVLLPEPFVIPDEFTLPRPSEKVIQVSFRLRSTTCDNTESDFNRDCIIISTRNNPYIKPKLDQTNAIFFLQIGTEQFREASGGFIMTRKQFDQLKDGDWIVYKGGDVPFGGVSIGKLNKSLLTDGHGLEIPR